MTDTIPADARERAEAVLQPLLDTLAKFDLPEDSSTAVIFRVTEPARWAPLDSSLHRPVVDGPGAANCVLAHAQDLLVWEGAGAA